MTEKCEHGVQRDQGFADGFASTEPARTCSCCGSSFYVIESAISEALDDGDDDKPIEHWRHEDHIWEPGDRCEKCCGGYVTRVTIT